MTTKELLNNNLSQYIIRNNILEKLNISAIKKDFDMQS